MSREAMEMALEALLSQHPMVRDQEAICALRAALAEAEAPKAEPVGDDPSLDPMIANAWDRFTAALDEAPMTDEEILALWQPPLEGAVQRPILGKNKILAFARAVLAHGRKR